jgi:hypothetical protein
MTKRSVSHIISLLAALVSICGCSTGLTWIEDKSANRNELVKVTGDWEAKYSVFIVKVDGKQLSSSSITGFTRTAYLKPGQHTLVIAYEHHFDGPGINGEGQSWSSDTLHFTGQPGKSYAIHRKLDGYKILFWIDEARMTSR